MEDCATCECCGATLIPHVNETVTCERCGFDMCERCGEWGDDTEPWLCTECSGDYEGRA